MMQVVDSKQKELSTHAIVTIAIQQTDSSADIGKALASIITEMKTKGTSVIRNGNTLFIIHHAKGRLGIFRPLNADTGRNYIENVKAFLPAAYKIGFDTLYAQFKDPAVLTIFKAIARDNPIPKGMGYQIKKTVDGGYATTIKLGPERGGK